MKTKLKNKNAFKKGARRIEAWVYTVINPLIEALKVEKSFLNDKNWTWRYQIKSLEFILPLEKYVDSASLPNFEDFLKANPQIERKRKKHDDLRAALSEKCQIASNHLIALEPFQEKAKLSLSTYKQESPTEEYPGGAIPEKDFDKLVAQYIINSIKELPGHYTTSKFWSRFGKELLQFRTGDVFEKLDRSGEQLEKEDERFLVTLENVRSNLCEEYDIPAAPIFYYDLAGQGR
jgi:hypothetical protein